MAKLSEVYSERVMQQRMTRKKRTAQYQELIDSSSDYDTDSISNTIDVTNFNLIDDETTATIMNQHEVEGGADDHYFPNECDFEGYYSPDEGDFEDYNFLYECDSINIDNHVLFSYDGVPPLYQHSTTSIGEAVKLIMTFYINSNFDKSKVVTLMRLIESLLPIPNGLPTTFPQILKIFGKNPSSITKFYCNNCLTLTTARSGQQFCTNSSCDFSDLQLSKRQLTEVVSMNVREKLQSVVRRNEQ
jgi:hypothetical protein